MYFDKRKRGGIFATHGELAQLARALAWHARGRRFDSDILHPKKSFISDEAFFMNQTHIS